MTTFTMPLSQPQASALRLASTGNLHWKFNGPYCIDSNGERLALSLIQELLAADLITLPPAGPDTVVGQLTITDAGKVALVAHRASRLQGPLNVARMRHEMSTQFAPDTVMPQQSSARPAGRVIYGEIIGG